MRQAELTAQAHAEVVASKVMEVAPLVLYFLRRNLRRKRVAISASEVRVLAVLHNCRDPLCRKLLKP